MLQLCILVILAIVLIAEKHSAGASLTETIFPRRRSVPVLFNVTLAIIAGYAADVVSVPYLSGYYPTQGNGYALLCYGHRLAIH